MHVTPTHLNLYKEIITSLNMMGFRSDQLGVWFIFILLSPWVSLANFIDEGDALYAFKRGLKDPNDILDTWEPTHPYPCTWSRISCEDPKAPNRVTTISLGGAGLSGPLSPRLGELTNLKYLYLYTNHFTGLIPPELGNLTKLVRLDLSSNSLTGPIPSELRKLYNLQFLYLQNNNLCGRAPAEAFFHNYLPHLEQLEIYPGNPNLCNPFIDKYCRTCRGPQCTICAYGSEGGLKDPRRALSSWKTTPYYTDLCTWHRIECDRSNTTVTSIDLGNAGLSGPLSPGLGSLQNLQALVLFQNYINGKIPPELGKLANLVTLDLHSNLLTGPIPAELGQCHQLTYVNLRNNNLCGTPPLLNSRTVLVRPGNPLMCVPFDCKLCKEPLCCK